MRGLPGLKKLWGLSGRKPDKPSSKGPPLKFDAPPMNPLPGPQLATLPDVDVWGFLQYVEPVEDVGMLAFQVSQLTLGMGELKRQIDELRVNREREI